MHEYLSANFTLPTATFSSSANAIHLQRRVFFYVPSEGESAVIRNREGRKFKKIKGIRKQNSIRSLPQQEKVPIQFRSCYCVSCLLGPVVIYNRGCNRR